MSEPLMVSIEMKGELPSDGEQRVDVVVSIVTEALDRLAWEANLAPCQVHQQAIDVMLDRMVTNGHAGCAGKLIDRLAIKMAQLQRHERPRIDS
jgi:hypothetical protein